MFNKSRNTLPERGAEGLTLIGIDIGTSRLRIIAGTVDDDGLVQVSYYDEVPSRGMVCGAVGDMFALSDALAVLLQNFQEKTGLRPEHCLVGVAGRHIISANEKGLATVQNRTVSAADRRHCVESARSVKSMSDGYDIVHVVPQYFVCDGVSQIMNPIGLSAMRVEAVVHVVSCKSDHARNLRAVLQRVSPEAAIDRFAFNGIAAADAVLSNDEKNIGVCLIDYGAGTVNVAVYENQHLILTFGLARGGENITRRIATKWGLPMATAEQIKYVCGVSGASGLTGSDYRMGEEDKKFSVKYMLPDGSEQRVLLEREQVAETIATELKDVFNSVSDYIERAIREMNTTINLGAGFVITGGVARTEGIEQVASLALSPNRYTPVKVKVASPCRVKWEDGGQPRGPESAVAVGLLRFGRADIDERLQSQPEVQSSGSGVGGFLRMVRDWFNKEL
ncbi:MAG: cell division protein FtsA [Proteobacteria bacterium]|uniref:Cell division protein FtsA n=1 Tax=Candidatus Avisuccinivibrio stercorigallinarum TaxID=2840704 RepID=A0A9D9D9W6_9GAMM|nr:cell division protein FtsA [Candidatus Avisuccinivibrio stercorigallinarum]